MNFTPLLALEVVTAVLVLAASSYILRLIKCFQVRQRIKKYPGTIRRLSPLLCI